MCQRVLLLIGLLSLASIYSGLALTAQEPNPRNDPQVHEGMIVSAGLGGVAIRGANGKEHSFKPNDKTRIMVHGKPGKLDDLKSGMQVRIMVDGNGMVATIATVDDRKGT